MTKDARIYLLHIRDALESIQQYAAQGEQHFLEDERTQDAILYKLAIIGEVVKRLPAPLRETYPEVPWKAIAGLRDIVIHEYDLTAIPRIWNVVAQDVPLLQKGIDRMLKDAET